MLKRMVQRVYAARHRAVLAVAIVMAALMVLPTTSLAATISKPCDGYGGPVGSLRPDLLREADVTGEIGQSFTARGGSLEFAELLALRSNEVQGSVYAYIYAADGVFGTDSVPMGAPLAISDAVDSTSVEKRDDVLFYNDGAGMWAWNTQPYVTFRFSGANKIKLAKGDHYVVALRYTDGAAGSIWTYYYDRSAYPLWTAARVHPGNMVRDPDGWLPEPDSDLVFAIWEGFSLPTVDTAAVTNVSASGASSGGNVTSEGTGTVSARGVCWSTSANPTVSDAHSVDASGTGTFTSAITGLAANTVYHVRAYATNEAGTSYGADLTFTTGGDSNEATGLLARKQAVLVQLRDLVPAGSAPYKSKLLDAIKHLQQSVDSKLWTADGSQAKSDKVFAEEKDCVARLVEARRYGLPDVGAGVAELVAVDRALAENMIAGAEKSGAATREIDYATKYLAEGDRLAAVDPAKAIEKYKSAWKKASEARLRVR